MKERQVHLGCEVWVIMGFYPKETGTLPKDCNRCVYAHVCQLRVGGTSAL